MSHHTISLRRLQSGYKLLHRNISTGALRPQKRKGDVPSHAYDMGTCGIPPWVVKTELDKEKEKEKIQLPSHLIRPPCLPGGEHGGFQTCIAGDAEGGMYCIPCRIKYKYPSFSENIDFIPPKKSECWWKGADRDCETDESALDHLTKMSPCTFDDENEMQL